MSLLEAVVARVAEKTKDDPEHELHNISSEWATSFERPMAGHLRRVHSELASMRGVKDEALADAESLWNTFHAPLYSYIDEKVVGDQTSRDALIDSIATRLVSGDYDSVCLCSSVRYVALLALLGITASGSSLNASLSLMFRRKRVGFVSRMIRTMLSLRRCGKFWVMRQLQSNIETMCGS